MRNQNLFHILELLRAKDSSPITPSAMLELALALGNWDDNPDQQRQVGAITFQAVFPASPECEWINYYGIGAEGLYCLIVEDAGDGQIMPTFGKVEALYLPLAAVSAADVPVLSSYCALDHPKALEVIVQLERLEGVRDTLGAVPQAAVELNLVAAETTIAAHAAGEWRTAPAPEFPALSTELEALLAIQPTLPGYILMSGTVRQGEIWIAHVLGGIVAFMQDGAYEYGPFFVVEGVTLRFSDMSEGVRGAVQDMMFDLAAPPLGENFRTCYEDGKAASVAKQRRAQAIIEFHANESRPSETPGLACC